VNDAAVDSLYRYPVKSLRGEAVDSLTFSSGHAEGDREWAIVDAANGVTLSAKRHGTLLQAAARTTRDLVVVTLPDGTEVVAGDKGADAFMSAWFGRTVSLRRAGEYNLPFELLDEPTDDDSAVKTIEGPAGHFADVADAHLLTDASLRTMAARRPDVVWDVHRFRPSVLIGGVDGAFPEDEWVDTEVAVGEVVFFVFKMTERCSLPLRAQPTLAYDREVARALREHHGFRLGVYASTREPGTVRVGEPIVVRRYQP
jgi:uncharacterized protein